jgi:hypothetical protein
MTYPDDKAAITVFTNIYPGAADAPGSIANRIAAVIMTPPARQRRGAGAGPADLHGPDEGEHRPFALHRVGERILHG